MLGEKIGEYQGKITGQRVLPSDGPGPKVETSFQVSGTILEIESTILGTYWAVVRPDGTLHGEGQGVTMTQDGDMASFTGSGVGTFTGRGSGIAYRGAIYYQTASPKLARLNRIAAVFEWDVDENGNAIGNIWEWK